MRSSTSWSGSLVGAIQISTSTSLGISSVAGLTVTISKLLSSISAVSPSGDCSPYPDSTAALTCVSLVTFMIAEVIACSALEEVM